MLDAVVEIVDDEMIGVLEDLGIHDKEGECTGAEMNQVVRVTDSTIDGDNHNGDCAICLDKIILEETALVKGCEHAYCLTCILHWASYKKEPTCPQCKFPFEFLNVHRTLDGSIQDFMFEESVCSLLKASWFKPFVVVEREEVDDEIEEYYYDYEDEDEDLEDAYFSSSPSLRIGNRRWGDNGFVSSGRQEARPVYRQNVQNSVACLSYQRNKKEITPKGILDPNSYDSGAGSSRQPKKKEPVAKEIVGRRAKRALKREAADKAAAEKHQQHLVRLGQK